jgi:hypothetical protein
MDLKDRFDQFQYGALHVRIVRDRTSNRNITGSFRRDALLDQCAGIDQESGADALFQPMISEVADFLAEFDEIRCDSWLHARFTLNHSRFDIGAGVVEFNRYEPLLGALLEIF